jgi:hypothetical protein
MAELIFKFDNPSELENWLQIFKKYGLENNLSLKSSKKKKPKSEQPQPSPERNWSSIGIGNLKGALDNIPNLRDYAYED